jgi:transcriptional antiterminator NusG
VSKDRSEDFAAGELVRIAVGPFTAFRGTVAAIEEDRARLAIDVTLYGRVARVELELGQVEKL